MDKKTLEKINALESKITQLSVIYSIASSIGTCSNEKEALEIVIDGIMDNLAPEIGIIFLFDEEKKELYPAVSRGIKLETISKEKVESGEYPSWKCFESGNFFELQIEDKKSLEPFIRRFPVKKVFCYPIKSPQKTLGVIHLSKFSSINLTEEERWILTVFSNRAGIAIESANLYKELERWGKSLAIKVEERTKEIESHLKKIKALERVSLKISSEMNISKSLPFIGRESSKILNAEKWAIFVVSKRKNELKKYFSSGFPENYFKNLKDNWKQTEGGRVIYEQKPLFIEDLFEVKSSVSKELAKNFGYRSMAIIPCIYRRTLVGVIIYYNSLKREYSEKEKELATAFGELTAIAIANSELFEKQKKTIKLLKALNKFGRALTSSLQIQKIYNEVAHLIQETKNYPLVFLHIFHREKNMLVQVARASRLDKELPKDYAQKPDQGIIGRAFKTGKIYVSGNVKNDPYYMQYFQEVNSELAVPIKGKDGSVTGVIDVQSEEPNAFEKEDIEVLTTIADQLSIVIENFELYRNLTNAVKELSTFYNLSRELVGILDMNELLNRTITNLKQLVPFNSGGILLYNPSLNALEVKAYLGPKLPEFKGVIEVGKGIVGNAFLLRKPILVSDVRKDTRYIAGVPGTLSELSVPLIYQDEPLGVLNIESNEINAYNEEHLRILNYFASQIAIALRNSILFEDLKKRAEEMKALNEISSVSISTLDPKKLYKLLSEKIMKIFNVDTFYIAILNHEKNEITFPFFLDRGKTIKLKPLKLEETKGLTGWIIKNRKPIIYLDFDREKDSLPVKPIVIVKVTQSYIGVPILIKGKVLGVISIQSYNKNAFTDWHFELLNTIANQVALALENARLFTDIKIALGKLKESQKKLIQTEKMRALGTASAGIAHQFNNILSAILARAQLLSERTSDPEIKKGLEIIEKASLGGADIVRRILGFSRVEEKGELEFVNLKQTIEEAIQLTEPRWKNEAEAKGKKIEIMKELEEDLIVKGNVSEFREVIVNLILNSIDALEKGGFIYIRFSSTHNKVIIEIKDNGIGISPQDLERVFDPFFTTKGVSGTGLGLSFVYGVVRKYKGRITIKSELQKGTSITIYLPKAKKIVEEKEEWKRKEEKPSLKILVIEDEEHVRDLIEEILKINGHKVCLARSGYEGISKFEKDDFDLVMTDLGMPGLSGWEVAERIRKKNKNIKIGFITGWNIRGEVDKLRKLGINFVITKPFKVEDIVSVITKEIPKNEIFVN